VKRNDPPPLFKFDLKLQNQRKIQKEYLFKVREDQFHYAMKELDNLKNDYYKTDEPNTKHHLKTVTKTIMPSINALGKK